MKNYLNFLRKHFLVLIVTLVIGFLGTFVLIETINQQRSYYESIITIDDINKFDDELLIDVDFLNDIKKTDKKYNNIDVEKMLNKKDFSYVIDENNIVIKTKCKYYDVFFIGSSNTVGTRAKTFIKDVVNKIADDKCQVTFKDNTNIVTLKNSLNSWIFSLYGLLITLLMELLISFIFLKFKKNNKNINFIYDNDEIFATCFHKKFWKLSAKSLIKVKDITTIAMLFALMLLSKLIPIPSGFGNLGLSFTYLFFAIISLIYGPIYGFIIGIFSDIIGYFMPNGGGGTFNLGYTLQAALSGFIYGICFYRTKVSFTKVLFSRFLINIFMNAIYGSFLFIFVAYYSDGMTLVNYLEHVKYYFLLLSLPKNILYLLPQSVLLYYVIKIINPLLARFKLIDQRLVPSSLELKSK